jgi:hypothetical protein
MMVCRLINGGRPDDVGMIPGMLDHVDPRPAREQLDTGYPHGGGWRPFDGFTFDQDRLTLKYPGDPSMKPLAMMQLREELVLVYPCSWVLVLQPTGAFEVCRMD